MPQENVRQCGQSAEERHRHREIKPVKHRDHASKLARPLRNSNLQIAAACFPD
jgi:hypothetical protein